MSNYILSLMTFIPLIAGILIAGLAIFSKKKQSEEEQDSLDGYMKWIALGVTIISFGFAIWAYFKYDPSIAFNPATGAGMQLTEHYYWIRSFNITYYVGIDGLSILMLLLTGFVSVVGVLASWNIKKKVKGYYALYLILIAAMYGVFVSLDFFLFYVFWELMLLPMYFLIGIWGGPRKEYAAIKFFIYTLVGSLFMLLGVIALYYNLPEGHQSFNILHMMQNADHYASIKILGLPFDKVVWLALFLGFAIKIPMFPFHTWLPDAHVQAPTPISIILAGVLLKMGTYGILRINYTIFPKATMWAATGIAVFGVINIVYGALVAMAQRDLKKLIAYSSVSHMGYVMLGMAGMTAASMNGAVLQMFSHGIITAMLFMLVGVIYDRAHHRIIDNFGGIAQLMPIYAAFAGIAWFAALGLPGFSGFIAEALIFLGSFPNLQPYVIIAALSVILTAAYMLWSYQRVFFGPIKEDMADKYHYRSFPDLSIRELLVLAPLAITAIVVGFYPKIILSMMDGTLSTLVNYVTK